MGVGGHIFHSAVTETNDLPSDLGDSHEVVLQKVGCKKVCIIQSHFGKINNNRNTHMDIVCKTLLEFGEKAGQMCILERKASRKIKKGKNALRNPVCYALFIENYVYACECSFYKTPAERTAFSA